jgi:hypothetical protein
MILSADAQEGLTKIHQLFMGKIGSKFLEPHKSIYQKLVVSAIFISGSLETFSFRLRMRQVFLLIDTMY